jgi:hypothetical protein
LTREAKKIAEGKAWAEANREALQALPSDKREGESQWDRYTWFMENAGNKGKIGIVAELKRMIAAE